MLLTLLIDGRMCCLKWEQRMGWKGITVRWRILQRVALTAAVCDNGQEGQKEWSRWGNGNKNVFIFTFFVVLKCQTCIYFCFCFKVKAFILYVGIFVGETPPFWLCIWLFVSAPHWPSNGIFLLKSENPLCGNVYVPINQCKSRFQWFYKW